jgi:hypothetical protein
MSKKKKNISKEAKEAHALELDKQICKLADDLGATLSGHDLIVAVAKIYSNSVLTAYIDFHNIMK